MSLVSEAKGHLTRCGAEKIVAHLLCEIQIRFGRDKESWDVVKAVLLLIQSQIRDRGNYAEESHILLDC